MALFYRLGRAIALPALFCLGIFVLLAAFVPIQQRLVRHRAESLLSDIRHLQLRQSTWADTQSLMKRWGSWGHSEGPCTKESCTYQIEMLDALTNVPMFWGNRLLQRPYEVLGGRQVRITANLTVLDGLVWGKGFEAVVQVPPEGGANAPFGGYGYALIGSSCSVSRFYSGYRPQLALHKNYLIGTPGGCTMCREAFTRFTPYSDPADVQRLMDFDLSCITRREPCREERQIMPTAWKQYEAEHQGGYAAFKPLPCCQYPLDLLGRDSENAAVVEVVSSRASQGLGYHMFQLRLVERLKGATFWDINTTREVEVADVERTLGIAPPEASPATRLILLFRGEWYGASKDGRTWLEPCGWIALTSKNLSELRVGLDQDFLCRRQSSRTQPPPNSGR